MWTIQRKDNVYQNDWEDRNSVEDISILQFQHTGLDMIWKSWKRYENAQSGEQGKKRVLLDGHKEVETTAGLRWFYIDIDGGPERCVWNQGEERFSYQWLETREWWGFEVPLLNEERGPEEEGGRSMRRREWEERVRGERRGWNKKSPWSWTRRDRRRGGGVKFLIFRFGRAAGTIGPRQPLLDWAR